jgi:hypothetical protein
MTAIDSFEIVSEFPQKLLDARSFTSLCISHTIQGRWAVGSFVAPRRTSTSAPSTSHLIPEQVAEDAVVCLAVYLAENLGSPDPQHLLRFLQDVHLRAFHVTLDCVRSQ